MPYLSVARVFISVSLLTLLSFRGDDNFVELFSEINQEILKNGRSYETLGEATATIGHRLTGSPNGTKAEQYAFNLLKKYGYADVKFQPFEMETWLRDTVTLEVVPNKSDNFREVAVVALAHSPVQSRINGQIVDVGNGLETDFEALKTQVKNRIVLANIGLINAATGVKNLHRSEKTALAMQYGAAGIIMANQVDGNVLLTGTASVTGSLIGIPAVCISKESGEQIRQWMKVDHDLHAIVDMRNSVRKVKARNVIATIKGKSSERIMIGGHLDSWDLATGTTDNGLGAFTVLDIARAFKALKIKPKRTIDFVLFMGEEQGLLGSRFMVKELARTKQLEKVRLMLNLDMTNDVYGINANGREELLPFFKATGAQIKQVDADFKNVVENQAGLHSDHQPFMLEGVPTAVPLGTLSAQQIGCYHADCDRFNLINKTQITNGTRFSAMLLYALANADEIPAKKLDSNKTRDQLVAQGLKKELAIGKDWKWAD